MKPCVGALAVCILLAANIARADTTLVNGDNTAAAPATETGAVHRVGDSFDYTVKGSMLQSILANDGLGKKIDQPGLPTALDGREHIAVKQISLQGLTLHRSGLIVAIVSNRSEKSSGKGWTIVRDDGSIAKDSGNLGGVFLLPLPFLGDRSVNAGLDLAVGTSWSEKLGTKLYGMMARPSMDFQITGQRLVLGVNVYELDATGSAPMKEPIVSNTGEALGYATGTAHISMHGEYDPLNHRIISMDIEVTDTLHIAGSGKRTGTVEDHQHYAVELDPASLEVGSGQNEVISPPVDAPLIQH
ncbi:MAG: hypothetical protein JO219_11335 [Candidatus Eremiobacteraeota bacterium]|nr:hypothetical protein [Candidatus Eremiobacteraeota bacterium]MBV8365107.1 hypothetical protein [Candidatus Eremiobacteraeota bacterium]